MKDQRIVIQRRAGGPEIEVRDLSMAAQISAKYQLKRDPEFNRLDNADKLWAVGTGKIILSLRDAGVETGFDYPERLTLRSCIEFEDAFASVATAYEIPTEPEGGDGADENPTATSRASS